MATIQKEIEIQRTVQYVWDAVRDVGSIHKRLVPGFVTDCKLEGNARIVTFGNGMIVRELIVSVDDTSHRHAWSARSEHLEHHNASVQIFATGENSCKVVWIADLLPNEMAASMDSMIQMGLDTMKQTLEK
jgi:hypothetical protein